MELLEPGIILKLLAWQIVTVDPKYYSSESFATANARCSTTGASGSAGRTPTKECRLAPRAATSTTRSRIYSATAASWPKKYPSPISSAERAKLRTTKPILQSTSSDNCLLPNRNKERSIWKSSRKGSPFAKICSSLDRPEDLCTPTTFLIRRIQNSYSRTTECQWRSGPNTVHFRSSQYRWARFTRRKSWPSRHFRLK